MRNAPDFTVGRAPHNLLITDWVKSFCFTCRIRNYNSYYTARRLRGCRGYFLRPSPALHSKTFLNEGYKRAL